MNQRVVLYKIRSNRDILIVKWVKLQAELICTTVVDRSKIQPVYAQHDIHTELSWKLIYNSRICY
jgi:hypothetical protein